MAVSLCQPLLIWRKARPFHVSPLIRLDESEEVFSLPPSAFFRTRLRFLDDTIASSE
jgi:hypothetical protein